MALQIIEAEMPQCFKFLQLPPPEVVVVYVRQALTSGITLHHDADAHAQHDAEHVLILPAARC